MKKLSYKIYLILWSIVAFVFSLSFRIYTYSVTGNFTKKALKQATENPLCYSILLIFLVFISNPLLVAAYRSVDTEKKRLRRNLRLIILVFTIGVIVAFGKLLYMLVT